MTPTRARGIVSPALPFNRGQHFEQFGTIGIIRFVGLSQWNPAAKFLAEWTAGFPQTTWRSAMRFEEWISRRLDRMQNRTEMALQHLIIRTRRMSESMDRFNRELQETLDGIAEGVTEIGRLAQELKDAIASGDTTAMDAASDKLDAAQASLREAIDAAKAAPPAPTEPAPEPAPDENPVDPNAGVVDPDV